MAEVLMVAGKPETVFNACDFEYLVEKHMGFEAAKYFREYAERADKELQTAKTETDLGSYEASLESNTRAKQDIQDSVQAITELLNAPRTNRVKIAKHIQEIGKTISNQI